MDGCESSDPVITIVTGSAKDPAFWTTVEFITLLNSGKISDAGESTLLAEN